MSERTHLGMLCVRRKLFFQMLENLWNCIIQALKHKQRYMRKKNSAQELKRQTGSNQMCYLLSVQLGQVAESHGEGLCVVLLDPEVDWLQAAHVEKQLGLLQSHGAARHRAPHKWLRRSRSESCIFTPIIISSILYLKSSAVQNVNPCIQTWDI